MKPAKQRRSIRLPDYDYAHDGAYYVTICTHERRCIFGDVINTEMILNTLGCIADEEWRQTAVLRPYIELDAYAIMPNHIHGIVVINWGYESNRAQHAASLQPPKGATRNNVQPQSLSAIIRAFKAASTRRINAVLQTPGMPLWQGRFYEHIIRNEQSLNKIRAYIFSNPAQWEQDSQYPENKAD